MIVKGRGRERNRAEQITLSKMNGEALEKEEGQVKFVRLYYDATCLYIYTTSYIIYPPFPRQLL